MLRWLSSTVLDSLFNAHKKREIGVLVDQLIVLIGLGGLIFIFGRSRSVMPNKKYTTKWPFSMYQELYIQFPCKLYTAFYISRPGGASHGCNLA